MRKIFSAKSSRRPIVKGFTLTEMAIVLGVMGLILAAIWIAAASIKESQRTQRAMNQITTIMGNFKTIFNSNQVVNIADSTDLSTLAINNKFVPSDMLSSSTATTLIGPWNNFVGVYSQQSTNTISITYYGLSQASCNHLANALANTPTLYWISISPNGTTGSASTRTVLPYGTQTTFLASETAAICINAATNYVAAAFSMN